MFPSERERDEHVLLLDGHDRHGPRDRSAARDAREGARVSKRRRVPPTLSDKRRRVEAVVEEHVHEPGVYRLEVRHDPACRALRTQSLADCTCEPEMRAPERVA
jgi:hypothetical protein